MTIVMNCKIHADFNLICFAFGQTKCLLFVNYLLNFQSGHLSTYKHTKCPSAVVIGSRLQKSPTKAFSRNFYWQQLGNDGDSSIQGNVIFKLD